MSEPITLIKKGDASETPVLFACSKCGHIYSPKIYAVKGSEALAAARHAAETCYACRTHDNCQKCGKETSKGRVMAPRLEFSRKTKAAIILRLLTGSRQSSNAAYAVAGRSASPFRRRNSRSNHKKTGGICAAGCPRSETAAYMTSTCRPTTILSRR